MKRKYANRPDWERVVDKEYKQIYIKEETFCGHISLLKLNRVKEPLFVSMDAKNELCIVDNGYTWLLYTPNKGHHSMTAMFNDKDELVQWYFDIAGEVGLTSEGIPYFDDLYLDVVVLPTMECFLLDEDELEEAYENGDIDVDEYNLSKEEAKSLMYSVRNNTNELIVRSCDDLLRIKASRFGS